MISNCETDLIYAYRRQSRRPRTKDALRTTRAVLRVHRSLQGAFFLVVLCGIALSSVCIALSEDRQCWFQATVNVPEATQSANLEATYPQLRAATSYKIAMSPHAGTGDIDLQIQTAQRRIREATEPRPLLETLGWLYVVKARVSYDPGFYKLAEQCAVALEVAEPNSPEALLLRGHLLINFHRFGEAEAIARRLVAQRTFPLDYGLLGDAVLEQGSLDEATIAYQRMVDLRPDLQSYSRVAHLRWLKGDVDGAIEVAQRAAGCTGPLDPESASWILARLALYYFQAGSFSDAKSACQAALNYSANYPPALLLEGRFLLIENKAAEAISSVQQAATINPLPEFQWALADALRLAGRADDSAKVEAALKRDGAENDPRTLALFLATRGEQIDFAIELGQREFQSRADVFTHDALAWALAAAGRLDEAWPHMEKALAEGTIDARLFLHAGVLEAKLGHPSSAESYLSKARGLERMLLPSERQHLGAALDTLSTRRDLETLSSREHRLAKASPTEQRKDRTEQ
jgi:tetratricopeptide (TPR) repeat protein